MWFEKKLLNCICKMLSYVKVEEENIAGMYIDGVFGTVMRRIGGVVNVDGDGRKSKSNGLI